MVPVMARKKPKPSSRRAWILGALLLGTVLAYAPVVSNELVNYDDDYYITANPNVRLGLSWEGLRWAATTPYGANWFPLTWLTWLAEYELFGLDPVMFHTTNLLLHLAATLILFHVFERMTGSRFRSAIVAAVFALHPMHVESVAWAAERKDVLSGLFWMLTMWAYVRYVDKPTLGRYAWVPIYLVLGLMAKPMLVTLPFALLLLDVWPLRRPPDTMFRKLILEKLPLVAIVTVSSIVTFYVQQAGGAVQALQTFSFRVRVANALIAYVVYLKKAILPTDLSVYYPHPGENVSMGLAFACGLALAAISAAVLWIAARDRERDYLAVGWFWYLGTLVPVIGLVQVGMQATADRYTYLPYIGLSILGAWGGAELVEHFRLPKLARVALSAAVLVAFAASAHARTKIWKDSVTLFEQALAVTEGNSLAHINLGYAYVARGRLDRAEEHLTAAVGLAPGAVEAHHGFGLLRRRQFRADDAIEHYREALWLDATSSQTHRELGNLLLTLGDLEQARTHLSEALALDPRNPDNHTNRGLLYLEEGEIERALELFEAATVLDSGHAQAHNNWGVALSSLGREDEAIPHFRHAVAVRPDYLEARLSWGLAEMRRGEMKNAVEQLKKALALAPDDGDVHLALGQALKALGDSSGASSHLNRAAAARRDDPATLHELGVRLAQSGSLPEAIDALERSLQLAPNRAETHVSLAMALGALGRFDEAIMGYQRAIELQPNFADAYNSWGVALASQGRVSEALPLFEKALALAPGFAAAHLNWGRALAEQGDMGGALAHFRKAVEIDSASAEAHNNLGVFLAREGELDAAVASFRRAVELDPADAQARRNLEATLASITRAR